MFDPTITSTQTFQDGDNFIILNISDTHKGFCVQMVVNGDPSEWYGFYAGLLVHKGYIYASAYWEGKLPIEKPFAFRELLEANTTTEKVA